MMRASCMRLVAGGLVMEAYRVRAPPIAMYALWSRFGKASSGNVEARMNWEEFDALFSQYALIAKVSINPERLAIIMNHPHQDIVQQKREDDRLPCSIGQSAVA